MAVVRLQFEIDQEIYPELYAAIAALSTPGARAERLRQLAASGLVWENVRIYGSAAIGPSPSAKPPNPQMMIQTPVSATEPPAKRARRATGKTAARSADGRGGDFVDLAISAEPKPHAPPDIARKLPVLMDVVAEVDEVNELVEPIKIETEPPSFDHHHVPEPEPELVTEGFEDPPHVPALALQPAKQSRLKRMKERGLFKNG